MKSILITAFGPYDHWETNTSELCLKEIQKDPPKNVSMTARVYPVDFQQAHKLLREDLRQNFDFVVHVGQSPKSDHVRLESFAINIGREPRENPKKFWKISESGSVAYQVALPLATWAEQLNEAGIPAAVSFHAGTRLCNAVLYWSHELTQQIHYHTQPILIHIPIDLSQAENKPKLYPSLPLEKSMQALKIILQNCAYIAP